MSDRRSYIALDWVTEEIVETLKQAVEALDSFLNNPEDVTKLRFCMTYTHQVAGSLVMVELQAASMLAREAETLIGSLLDDHLRHKESQVDTGLIHRSLQELSEYLVRVKETHQDNPARLLGILNGLREANKQEEVSAADVFQPDVVVTKPVNPQQPAITADDFNELIRKLRQSFQKGLIGIVRDQDREANCLLIAKVCGTLKKISLGTASEPLWKIAYIITEYLFQARIPADIEFKKALKQVDGQIRHLEERGRDGLGESPPSAVLNVLLYVVATAEPATKSIQQLREEYRLGQVSTQEASESQGIGEKLLRTIARRMASDLAAIADACSHQQGKILLHRLTCLYNTFALLQVDAGKTILEPVTRKVKSRVLANESIESCAADVGQVTAASANLVQGLPEHVPDRVGFATRYRELIQGGRDGLGAIKELIVSLLAEPAASEQIDTLTKMLEQESRRLNVSPLRELVPLLDQVRKYILDQFLSRKESPASSELESLADILSAVDYYLECAIGASDDSLAAILQTAQDGLGALGLTAEELPVAEVDEEIVAGEVCAEALVVEEEVAVAEETPPAVPELPAADIFTLAEDVDSEILEIFIEEGREVVEHILEYLPQLKADYENQEALLEVRRSYHTLKGSGRMVGAMPLGDFAWSIERMLNNVRDSLAKITPNCITIVEEATALVPTLLNSLEASRSVDKSLAVTVIKKADAEWERKPQSSSDSPAVVVEEEEEIVAEEAEEISDIAEISLPEVEQDEPAAVVDEVDEELLSIFIAEAETHIAAFCQFLEEIDPGYEDVHVTSDLQRALHTLKGSAHMAGVSGMAELVTPLEAFVKDLNNFQTKVDGEILALLMRAADLLQDQLDLLKQHRLQAVEGLGAFVSEIKALHGSRIGVHEEEAVAKDELSDKYTALLSEALDCMTEAASLISDWQAEGIAQDDQQKLVALVHRLGETAQRANYPEVAGLALALASYYQQAISVSVDFDGDFFALANKAHDELDDMMDMIAAQQVVEPAEELIAELTAAFETRTPSAEVLPVAKATVVHEKSARMPALRQQLLAADSEMLEIFAEEAGELSESLNGLMEAWFAHHSDRSALGEIKRILHTIKGGARLTELFVLGDLAHEYESLVEHAEADNRFDDLFFASVASYQDELSSLVDYVIQGNLEEELEAAPEAVADVVEEPVPEVAEREEIDVQHEVVLTEPAVEPVEEPAAVGSPWRDEMLELAEQYRNSDQDTVGIFIEELQELSEQLDTAVSQWVAGPEENSIAAELKRILHTVKGGARMAELRVLGDMAHEYESMIESAEARGAFPDSFFIALQSNQDRMNRVVDFLLAGANPDQIPAPVVCEPVSAEAPHVEEVSLPEDVPVVEQPIIEQAAAEEFSVNAAMDLVEEEEAPRAAPANIALLILADQYSKADPETLSIFLEEVGELVDSLESSASSWLQNRVENSYAAELKRVLHTIKGSARMTELAVLGDLAHDFESMIEVAEAKRNFDEAFFDRVQSCQDQMRQMADFLLAGANVGEIPVASSIAVSVPAESTSSVELPVVAVVSESSQASGEEVLVQLSEDIDAELVELFVEEAKEQLEGIEGCIAAFLNDRGSADPLEELKRLLHTLKGGSRLAGVKVVGDLSHDFETYIISGEREKTTGSDTFIDEMQSFHEKLVKYVGAIKVAPKIVVEPVAESTTSTPVHAEKPLAEARRAPSNVVPIRPGIDTSGISQAAIDATRNFIDNFSKEKQKSNKEPIKITPEQLQQLINLAGESSIGRSRIEEQVSELSFSRDEMNAIIDRLHAQLRRLEIETEAQILFRQEQVVNEGQENFDPLEMDRYTQMQQISKSLMESASDISDFTSTLTAKTRDLETLLVQQARINSQLQENLMRCQMVPFSRMVPRLRRIVRQVAQELGKRIEFDVENAEGELDRSILERMVAPLEHMLRNAVDHGIEMPDVRVKAGKNPQGTIILALSREGGEVVLRLRDDGGGVNVKAVRKKAIERGLIDADSKLSDQEITKFIMHAGFSTAEKVTQISGRGVGMDVVHSEIKQMGGTLDIQSVEGKGSTFVVRLPFTVSVNRALMVCIGGDTYAIPLNSIEGIVRVSPYELEAYYQPDAPMFEYAGQSYHLRYMGSLLQHDHVIHLEGLTTPLPVVLIRSSDYSVAVQVDRLLGSREIVVKSLGPQFGMVEGLSGATVLGDGSVVIILDMLALIRTDALKERVSTADVSAAKEKAVVEKVTTVMVTDDSVTVRKVTSRLLERFGMKAVLAKDGLDAITQLQDMDPLDLPDIMLLDIEMPRMDGFEVLNRVRHNEKLQHIPICMITSRTGEKHRERAIALGATRYLGKPFQERELLQIISELTGAEVQQA